jgi:hypothetical protein
MLAAKNISFVALIAFACMLQSCAGEPADLKCSLVPCHMEPPAALTVKQTQAWHDCMSNKHQFPIVLSTSAMNQRDYDDCVAEAKAIP